MWRQTWQRQQNRLQSPPPKQQGQQARRAARRTLETCWACWAWHDPAVVCCCMLSGLYTSSNACIARLMHRYIACCQNPSNLPLLLRPPGAGGLLTVSGGCGMRVGGLPSAAPLPGCRPRPSCTCRPRAASACLCRSASACCAVCWPFACPTASAAVCCSAAPAGAACTVASPPLSLLPLAAPATEPAAAAESCPCGRPVVKCSSSSDSSSSFCLAGRAGQGQAGADGKVV